MTVDEAIAELLNTEDFQQGCKGNDKLRIYRDRIEQNKASSKVKIDLLTIFGYRIIVESPFVLVKKKNAEAIKK